MPYPEGHKQKVRGRIVESAAKAFRAQGIRDISVPSIMKGAGLTHGGFYAHFEHKEQLVAEACGFAASEMIALLRKTIERNGGGAPLDAVIDAYLNADHRDHPELGCILPALSAEISRCSDEVRRVYTSELERMVAFLSEIGGIDLSVASALLGLMVGSLTLARSVNDPAASDRLLEAGRQQAKRLAKP